jgi:hypothetical protein
MTVTDSTRTRDTGERLEAEVHEVMSEARRLGNRIYAGETIPQGEMDAYYARRAELDERLDARHRERVQ